MAETEKNRLLSKLEHPPAQDWAETVDTAKQRLMARPYGAVVVDERLGGPGWRELTRFAREKEIASAFLICTDEVGGKALFAESKKPNTFISDVLVRPYSGPLVQERIEAALRAHPEHVGATLPSHPAE